MVYTSPLTVKVYEEVKEKRKEEVDLETGRRRSYLEEERYEVLDLTGDTPGRRGSQRTPLQPLPSQNSEAATKTTKTWGREPPPPTKSPLPLPDISVLCLSSPTVTSGAAAGPRTAGTRQGVTERGHLTALTTKYPLLR